jgi:diguanylate cyclase (GGDEF)-like protein
LTLHIGRKMISIKKYLLAEAPAIAESAAPGLPKRSGSDLLSQALAAYGSALSNMGRSGVDACPASGPDLERHLAGIALRLARDISAQEMEAVNAEVQAELQHWGSRTARHYQQKAGEVKEILLVMATAAESVGERDQLYAHHIQEVTGQLKRIANLDDITQIRDSIEKTASELKSSIDRMAAEGKAAMEQLQQKVLACQLKLEDAEQLASQDALTRVRSRVWVEGQMEQRIAAAAPFCVAILDLDCFKKVNDEHGHLVGDELLRQFGSELRAAGRAVNIIGRWGGDEFVVVLDCDLPQAQERVDRLSAWVCGSYTVEAAAGPVKLRLSASIGLAQFTPPETLKQLLERADLAMYRQKAADGNSDSRSRR